jgi:hypothetical protein
MEYAVLVTPFGRRQLVSITQMKILGKGKARQYDYECPNESCKVRVFPAFPEPHKSGRHKAPRPYFSARKESHIEGCHRDRNVVMEDVRPPRIIMEIDSPEAEALLARYPTRFDESGYVTRTSRRSTPVSDADVGGLEPLIIEGRSTGEPSEKERLSKRGSRHVRKFVEVYELYRDLCPALPIEIEDCPADNFEGAFLEAVVGVDARGEPGPRHIYYGKYGGHSIHKKGIAIYFRGNAVDGKRLSVWMRFGLGPARLQVELVNRLKRAAREGVVNSTATVYALGLFHPWQDWKYTITLTQLGQFWVSFPGDYSQQP